MAFYTGIKCIENHFEFAMDIRNVLPLKYTYFFLNRF